MKKKKQMPLMDINTYDIQKTGSTNIVQFCSLQHSLLYLHHCAFLTKMGKLMCLTLRISTHLPHAIQDSVLLK